MAKRVPVKAMLDEAGVLIRCLPFADNTSGHDQTAAWMNKAALALRLLAAHAQAATAATTYIDEYGGADSERVKELMEKEREALAAVNAALDLGGGE